MMPEWGLFDGECSLIQIGFDLPEYTGERFDSEQMCEEGTTFLQKLSQKEKLGWLAVIAFWGYVFLNRKK